MSRLAELERAKDRLRLLVDAVVLVRNDSTANEMLLGAMDRAADIVHDGEQLQHVVTIALAHAYAQLDVETRDAVREMSGHNVLALVPRAAR